MYKEKTTLLTPGVILQIVMNLQPGERFVYYSGYLPHYMDKKKYQMKQAAMILQEFGFVLLTAKKLGFQDYDYYMTRSTTPMKLDYDFRRAYEELK